MICWSSTYLLGTSWAYCYNCGYCGRFCQLSGYNYTSNKTYNCNVKHQLSLIHDAFLGLDKPKVTAPTKKAPSYTLPPPPSESTWVSYCPPFFLALTAFTAADSEIHFAVGTQNQGKCPPPPFPHPPFSQASPRMGAPSGGYVFYEDCMKLLLIYHVGI